MHDKVVELLETIGIDVAWMEYEGNAKEYIIFDIYNEEDSDFADDENESETYNIEVNYWFKSKKNINKYKQIKELMKNNGFMFDSSIDRKDDGYYGKSMDFIYVEYKKEVE